MVNVYMASKDSHVTPSEDELARIHLSGKLFAAGDKPPFSAARLLLGSGAEE